MITLRFYANLNNYLHPQHRGRSFSVLQKTPVPARVLIESLGVPVADIGLLLVNGEAVELNAPVQPGDRLSVYPEFQKLNVSSLREDGD